jgi:flagellar M-ring protein FliF
MQSNESTLGNGGEASGVPGALSNQPPPNSTAPIESADAAAAAGASASAPVNSQKNMTTNYEVDKTVSYTQQPMGGVKRIQVAVVVNHLPVTGKDGKVTFRPLTDAEKQQVNDLAMQAMGFNKERGDSITVVNTPFAVEPIEALPAVPMWKSPTTVEYGKDALRFIVGIVVLMLVYKRALKPLMTKLMSGPPLLSGPSAQQNNQDAIVNLSNDAGQARIGNSSYEQSLGSVRQLAKENPRMVASVVSNWTNGE